MLERFVLPLVGLGVALLAWSLGIHWLARDMPIAESFAPGSSFTALSEMFRSGVIWPHLWTSLRRVAVALLCACAVGIPLGVLSGAVRRFAQATSPLFQLLRMISPLSWVPLAVMFLGIGDAPVYFLLSFAAVWPILLNTAAKLSRKYTAAGVTSLDPNWMMLARSLSATRWETISRVILPGITAHVLTGIRLAIGIIWIVLVPAEMLGVSSGLGYFILDTRDRLAYSELMAVIVLIGVLGFLLDLVARLAYRRWLHVDAGSATG
jgi:NitT/TauT family transport system permease protein